MAGLDLREIDAFVIHAFLTSHLLIDLLYVLVVPIVIRWGRLQAHLEHARRAQMIGIKRRRRTSRRRAAARTRRLTLPRSLKPRAKRRTRSLPSNPRLHPVIAAVTVPVS